MGEKTEALRRLDVSWHVNSAFSPNSFTTSFNTQVMRMQEMISKLEMFRCLTKFSYLCYEENIRQTVVKRMHADVSFLSLQKATVAGEIGDVITGKLSVPEGTTKIFKSLGKYGTTSLNSPPCRI